MRQWPLIIYLVLTLLTTGCDQARRKFDQVHLGMTRAEVVRILGEPQGHETKTPKAGDVLFWRLGSRTITLQINHDRVLGKQLSGPARRSQKDREKNHV
jgi:hypothetical protein